MTHSSMATLNSLSINTDSNSVDSPVKYSQLERPIPVRFESSPSSKKHNIKSCQQFYSNNSDSSSFTVNSTPITPTKGGGGSLLIQPTTPTRNFSNQSTHRNSSIAGEAAVEIRDILSNAKRDVPPTINRHGSSSNLRIVHDDLADFPECSPSFEDKKFSPPSRSRNPLSHDRKFVDYYSSSKTSSKCSHTLNMEPQKSNYSHIYHKPPNSNQSAGTEIGLFKISPPIFV